MAFRMKLIFFTIQTKSPTDNRSAWQCPNPSLPLLTAHLNRKGVDVNSVVAALNDVEEKRGRRLFRRKLLQAFQIKRSQTLGLLICLPPKRIHLAFLVFNNFISAASKICSGSIPFAPASMRRSGCETRTGPHALVAVTDRGSVSNLNCRLPILPMSMRFAMLRGGSKMLILGTDPATFWLFSTTRSNYNRAFTI